jgi:hypothetical protein
VAYLRGFSAKSSAQRRKSLPKYSGEVSAELSVKPHIWIDSYSRRTACSTLEIARIMCIEKTIHHVENMENAEPSDDHLEA